MLDTDLVATLLVLLQESPGVMVTADLITESVAFPDGKEVRFAVAPFSRYYLLNGIDELAFTLSQIATIEAFERQCWREDS